MPGGDIPLLGLPLVGRRPTSLHFYVDFTSTLTYSHDPRWGHTRVVLRIHIQDMIVTSTMLKPMVSTMNILTAMKAIRANISATFNKQIVTSTLLFHYNCSGLHPNSESWCPLAHHVSYLYY